jgi:hypothetical protein
LEWLSVAPIGLKFLINDDDPQAITAYIPPKAITGETPKPATMTVSLQDGEVIVSWNPSGILQEANKVNGPWNDIAGAASPRTVAPNAKAKYYRVRH